MYLTVMPALLGVLVVAALAYWGQYHQQVPHLVVVVAGVATMGTLALAWLNARYVALRVERLAGSEGGGSSVTLRGIASAVAPGHVGTPADELDTIEEVVDRLSSAVAVAESGKEAREQEMLERARDYSTLMASVAEDVEKRLEDIRLPLHILLENRFGELNENQEEMLGAARAAADAADADVVAMHQLADLDRGARPLRHDRILPGDLVKALVPTLQAQAEKQGATLRVDIEPLIPAIWGDQPQLQEALSTLLSEAVARADNTDLELRLQKAETGCEVVVRGGGTVRRTVRTALAMRLVGVMGGRVDRTPGELRIALSVGGPRGISSSSVGGSSMRA
jgi:signal transduction histidine kinase